MKKQILENRLEVSAVGLGCMGMSRAYGTSPGSTAAVASQMIIPSRIP